MTSGAFTLVSWIDAVARAQPERPAVFSGRETLTYGRLWGRSERVAHSLFARHGVEPQSRVALIGRNDAAFLVAYLGILRAGCVAVPLNHLLQARDLARQLEFAEVECCLLGAVEGEARDAVTACCRALPIDELHATSASPLPAVSPQSKATILLTSGSTGSPKGVLHTHGTLLHAALLIAAVFPFSRDDVTIAFLPFFASIPEHVLPALVSGAALDVLPRFDPEAVSAACERGTSFDAVPTIMARLLEHGDLDLLRRLRWVMFASEPMPPALLARWWDCLPDVATYELYGMTEMLTITYATPRVLREEPRSVGLPFPTSRVETVDDDGRARPAGEEGEVTCASPARMAGYFRSPRATEAALTAEGAMRTGDAGCLDEGGRLYLTGRMKDLIITGGLNVPPAEIEAVACRHPAVAAASVVGIPDARFGETPAVVAVPKDGTALAARDLLAFCRAELSSFKRPSAAAIVRALPMTGIGKSAKAELREAVLRGELELVRAEEVELERAR